MSRTPAAAAAVAATLAASVAVAAAPASASRAGFLVVEAVTTRPDAFLAEWRRPVDNPQLPTDSSTVRGRPVTVFVTFKGCRPDPAGRCDVAATLEVIDPKGVSSGKTPFAVWPRRPPLALGLFMLSQSGPSIGFGPADPLGSYRFRLEVTDRVAGVTLRTEQALQLS